MREPKDYEAPLCATVGGDFWFPEKTGGSITNNNIAKSICSRCPHKKECYEWGVNRELYGIWGGVTESERILIRARLGITLREAIYD